MGIQGLLRHLKDITRPVQLQELRGLTVGVDANGWLYRGCFTCLGQLLRGVDTDENIKYCMRKVETLLGHGITPLLVFDGAPMPLKADNAGKTRREQRQVSLEKAKAALKVGEDAAAEAHYSKAFTVTHDMVRQFITELVRRGVKYMVAPYEADAQLAYLSHTKQIHAVITEDSDCIVYGCRRVLFKFDGDGGKDSVQEIRKRDLAANISPPLQGWTNSMFLDMCILAGCDYVPGIHGIGIITAHKLVSRFRGDYRALLAYLRGSGSPYKLPNRYEDDYERARLTFRHQTVYNSSMGRAVPLMPLGSRANERPDLSFLGPILPSATVVGVALSTLHPVSLEPYSNSIISSTLHTGSEGKSPPAVPDVPPLLPSDGFTAANPVHRYSVTNSKKHECCIQDCASLDLEPSEKNTAGQGDNHDCQHYEKFLPLEMRDGMPRSHGTIKSLPAEETCGEKADDENCSREVTAGKELKGELTTPCESKFLPFFPASAQNFSSQCVDSRLETLHRKRRRDGRGQPSKEEECGSRGAAALKWLDNALREESGYDYDGGGEIGTVDYVMPRPLEREQTQQEHDPPQGSWVRLGSDSLEQYCEEKIEDKEISARLQSSEICRGLLLHGNGYEENRQSPSDGRGAPIVVRDLEKTVGVASHIVDQSSINSSCIYFPSSSSSTMEIEDNNGRMVPNSLQVVPQQRAAWKMNVGTFHPPVASCGDDGHATTLETKWDERLK